MSNNWKYVSGDWNAICDSCGKKVKASKLRRRWDGFMVCEDDYEMRHPQDFIRAKKDKISVPFTRPVPQERYISITWTAYPQDTITILEDLNPATINAESISGDQTTLSDNLSYVGTDVPGNLLYKGFTDSIALSENLTYSFIYNKSLTDSVTLSEPEATLSSYVLHEALLNGNKLNELMLG